MAWPTKLRFVIGKPLAFLTLRQFGNRFERRPHA
jgi:hypothetical protein